MHLCGTQLVCRATSSQNPSRDGQALPHSRYSLEITLIPHSQHFLLYRKDLTAEIEDVRKSLKLPD